MARFYDDHFEITGGNVKIRSGYGDIEDVKRVKVRFFSDTVVLVSVRGSARTFKIPNKENRKLKIELYSWLLRKIQRTKSNSAEL